MPIICKIVSKTDKVWSPILSKVYCVHYRRYEENNKEFEAADILRMYLKNREIAK
jgi:hypothetical protein